VLFADVRGYTARTEVSSPQDMARLMNRFYAAAIHVLSHHDAVIDKLVGDEVMALFIQGFAGRTYIEKMAEAAEDLLRDLDYGRGDPWLPVGVGLDFGRAFVGNVGTAGVKDFTALGDVVNTAARIQGHAQPGQIVMTDRVYEVVGSRYPDALFAELTLKGKREPVPARIVDLSAPPVAP
jgi:adenylate cyclase